MDDWTTYTETEGLISNLIYSSGMDGEGRMWFGGKHPNGIACYDGDSWQRHTVADCDLGPGHIWDIAVDLQRNMWFGTAGGGVTRYNGRSWKRYTMEDGLAGNHVYAVTVRDDGTIWLGCAPEPDVIIQQGGVSMFDGTRFECLTSDFVQGQYVGGGNSGLCDNRVYAIVFDRDGNAWFGTKGGGICCYTGLEWHTWNIQTGFPSDEVGDGAAALDDEGYIWFGLRGGGACRFDGLQGWTTFGMNEGLAGDFVYAITPGPDKRLWFGCAPDPEQVTAEGGVTVFDGTTFQGYTSDFTGGEFVGGGNSPLADNRVYTISFDREGDGWFGTKGGGVSRLARDTVLSNGL
jgi:ligand-binding sensor domain-containing protein